MTKVIMREKKNGIEFGTLEVGDCFLDKDNIFCIKINSTTCLVASDDLDSWIEYNDCDSFEEVCPVDVEIHIVS
jgi:hypothetical protein